MPKKRILSPQSVWDADAIAAAFAAVGAKPSHIYRLYRHLIHNPGSTWHDVHELPKRVCAALDAGFTMFTTKLIHKQVSSDGETIKLLIELQDGLQVESVVMHYDSTTEHDMARPPRTSCGQDASKEEELPGPVGGPRSTLCVSSQVGCQMGCTFCATGTMGLTADLTAGEIIEQLVHARMANPPAPITNIVYMGMGEPLNNYAAVKSAVSLMTHAQGFCLRRRGVTVSTVGVIPRIKQLAEDLPGVSLALSLHAPNQELRSKIVPSARAYKLDKLMATVYEYQERTRQRVFVEYVMLGPDVNCQAEHARELGKLLQGRNVIINLIPWNPILSPGMDFKAPAPGANAEFQRILKDEYGLRSTLRKEKGQDVSAACGQLVLEHGGRCGSASENGGIADVEDLVGGGRSVRQPPSVSAS